MALLRLSILLTDAEIIAIAQHFSDDPMVEATDSSEEKIYIFTHRDSRETPICFTNYATSTTIEASDLVIAALKDMSRGGGCALSEGVIRALSSAIVQASPLPSIEDRGFFVHGIYYMLPTAYVKPPLTALRESLCAGVGAGAGAGGCDTERSGADLRQTASWGEIVSAQRRVGALPNDLAAALAGHEMRSERPRLNDIAAQASGLTGAASGSSDSCPLSRAEREREKEAQRKASQEGHHK